LGELAESDVEAAQSDFEAASAEYTSVVAVRQSLHARLLDPVAEAQLIAAKQDIEALKPDYTQQVVDAFAAEYEAASRVFARSLARGKALSAALRIEISMPVPQPALEANSATADGAALSEVTRIGSALDGLNVALNEITNQRDQAKREANRRVAYAPGLTWRFIRPYGPLFEVGDLTAAPIISEAMLERLHHQKFITLATPDEPSAAAAELDAALPEPA